MGILDNFRLDGRVALVTGASRGLGQAMAVGLAEAGADIAALDLTGCDDTCRMVTDLGRRYHAIACDLRQASVEDLNEVAAGVISALGRLDILVNNAGIIRREAALDFSESDWEDVLAINLKALFFLSQAAGRVMAQQGGGKIINVASMLSFQGGIRVISYTAAKSGVAGVTRALANELASRNINVNAIAPGLIVTKMAEELGWIGKEHKDIPLGRLGSPEDVARAALFLASDMSAYVTGQTVNLNGGMHMA